MRLAGLVALLLLLPAASAAAKPSPAPLQRYAKDTWASFVAMTDARSGLPADILNADGTTSVQTSTTNIGAYMWSAVVARRLRFIDDRELVERLSRTLTTLEHMERFADTGQYYNWYDHRTGAKLTFWPPKPTDEFHPILSSVDNGWLAVGLKIVENSVPRLRKRAGALYDAMDFGFYYRPDVNRVLFHYQPDDPGRRRAATTPSSARAASSTTSASAGASCRRRSTTGAGAPSRTPVTSASRRPSRSVSRAGTSASTSSRGPTRTTARGSCPRGAGACSRR